MIPCQNSLRTGGGLETVLDSGSGGWWTHSRKHALVVFGRLDGV